MLAVQLTPAQASAVRGANGGKPLCHFCGQGTCNPEQAAIGRGVEYAHFTKESAKILVQGKVSKVSSTETDATTNLDDIASVIVRYLKEKHKLDNAQIKIVTEIAWVRADFP